MENNGSLLLLCSVVIYLRSSIWYIDRNKRVRMTAHSARTQHMMTKALMRSFMVTAKHIDGTLIPMDKDLARECFDQIITKAVEMKEEAMKTRHSYFLIQTKVQKNLGKVNEKYKSVMDEQKRIEIEAAELKKLTEDEKLAQKQLKEEKQRMEENLKRLQSERDKWMVDIEIARKGVKEETNESFIKLLIESSVKGLDTTGIATFVTKTGVNLISSVFGLNKEENELKGMMQSYKESQESVEKQSAERIGVIVRMQELRKTRLERLKEIKQLNSQKENLGHAGSLSEASVRLNVVDRQFFRIINFWDTMVETLKILKDDIYASGVYLKKLEKPTHAERFKNSIHIANQGWIDFGKICGDYVFACDNDKKVAIGVLYDFLSPSRDDIPKHAQEERMRAIESEIEESINIFEEENSVE